MKKRKQTPAQLANLKKGKPFVKGDPRINRLGRASSFDQLRELFQGIANEEIQDGNEKITRIREIGLTLSGDPKLMKEFLEFAYGKVPLSSIVDITSGGKPITWKDFISGTSGDSDTSTSGE